MCNVIYQLLYGSELYTNVFEHQQNFEAILILLKVPRVIKPIPNALSTSIYDKLNTAKEILKYVIFRPQSLDLSDA